MKKNKDAIVILLVIFIILGFAWGPMRSGKLQLGNAPTSTPVQSIPGYPDYPSNNNYPTTPVPTPTTPTIPGQSVYYGKVTISSVINPNYNDSSQQYITLYSNLGVTEKLNITGWTLRSERVGNWAKIGQASLLPFPQVRNYQDIILSQGDMVYIAKGFSPVGISYRSNKCTGYFVGNNNLYPYIRKSCPLPRDEKLPLFSSDPEQDRECIALIESLPACTIPDNYLNLNRLSKTLPSSCKTYLQTRVSYNSCVATHANDQDFVGKEWYVFLSTIGPLWAETRDKITLYDNDDLIVSTISY